VDKIPWYVARSSGIVAWVLVLATIVWGLLLATKVLGVLGRDVGDGPLI